MTNLEETALREAFSEWLLHDFDSPPERQTHRWVFCADTPEIRDSDCAYDCACCFGKDMQDSLPPCTCVCHQRIKQIADFFIAKMKARDSAEKERIDSRLAYMFANAPETYHAIKQILYAD